MYTNPKTFTIHTRYNKTVTVPAGYESDGATGGIDVCNNSFFAHDWLCANYTGNGPKPTAGLFDDGSKCTNWQASTIHSDILKECAANGNVIDKVTLNLMSIWRWPATWLFGGGKARENGMF